MSKVTYINILKRQLTLQFTAQKDNRADFSGFWGLQAEKAKFKSKKKAAQIMLEKEKALDEMRAGRLKDEERMHILEKERELARAERDRLSQALHDLTEEQHRRVAEEEELDKQKEKRLCCLDITDDSIEMSPVKGKEELLQDAEDQRDFMLTSHAKERTRQENVLRDRMQMRNRRRDAGKNKWEEAAFGGMAYDASVPGGMS
mmetsp:Transcript_41890/g.67354  ORF Transcript_41890/g.67354 Transcript_41890/m.67354 type:complete len:203 (+) Transcript_41890:1756-2364(+)